MNGESLTLVGTGYRLGAHVTPEAQASMVAADRLFYLISAPGAGHLLRSLNPRAESLHDCYREGRDGVEASEEMVERILSPLREGLDVCAAFSGHPAVFMHVPHECLRRGRREGLHVRMLPAVSVVDCLFADLEIDPAREGCQLFEATDLLVRRRTFDPSVPLILLQAGALGVVSYQSSVAPNRPGLRLLTEALLRHYASDHEVVVYEIDVLPPWDPLIRRVPLGLLAEAPVTVVSTLFLPPMRPAADANMAACLTHRHGQ